MEVIFVVVGHAGSHDDYRSWTSKGFHKRNDAVLYQQKCIDEANRINEAILEMERKRFTFIDGGLVPEIDDPVNYWTDVQSLIDSNKVDVYFEHDNDFDYTIDALEIE